MSLPNTPNPKLDTILGTLQKVRDLSSFQPTEAQRKVKGRFWSYFESSDALPPAEIDLSTASRYGAHRSLPDWWAIPGFTDWFTNRDEFRQRMEYLAQRALDELETILASTDERSGATKVQAIRIIMDISNKAPKSATDKFLDERVQKMSEKELEEFISKNVRKLNT